MSTVKTCSLLGTAYLLLCVHPANADVRPAWVRLVPVGSAWHAALHSLMQVWRTLSQSFSLPGPLGLVLLFISYLWYAYCCHGSNHYVDCMYMYIHTWTQSGGSEGPHWHRTPGKSLPVSPSWLLLPPSLLLHRQRESTPSGC